MTENSSNAPTTDNRTAERRIGFDLSGARARLAEATKTEIAGSERAAGLLRVGRWLLNVEVMHLPENLAAARWVDELKSAQAEIKALARAALRRAGEEQRHRDHFISASPHMDRRVALAQEAAKRAVELIATLAELRELVPAYDNDPLPPADSLGGQPSKYLLGDIELALFDSGIQVHEIDALLARDIAGNPNSTEQTREAAYAKLRKRIGRARERRTKCEADEAAAVVVFMADDGNARALAAWEAEGGCSGDTTIPPGSV